jgi:hypothetical protein
MGFLVQEEYEQFIYGLANAYPQITRSTLSLYTISATAAVVEGSLFFDNGLELQVVEVLDFKNGRIQRYGYTVLRGEERVRWYDAQPHPESPALASTFPHHCHEPPAIKDNRRPAPGISFTAPNLPTLIADCIELGKTSLGNVRP